MVTKTQKSPGRPKSVFISKKPAIKQDRPGRPKKIKEVIEIKTTVLSNKQIPTESKTKDAFILIMFLFSLCVFIASLYFSNKKEELERIDTINMQKQIEEINSVREIETNAENRTGAVIEPKIENPIQKIEGKTTSIEKGLLINFYKAFNENQMREMLPQINTTLRNSTMFKTYFSKTRIQRFLKNIKNNEIEIKNIESKDGINRYIITYTLENGTNFEEIREMTILEKEIPEIGKMMCINTGCSTLPFFNPGKYLR